LDTYPISSVPSTEGTLCDSGVRYVAVASWPPARIFIMNKMILLPLLIPIFFINCATTNVSSRGIKNIRLLYRDLDKLKVYEENKHNMSPEEESAAYSAIYTIIDVNEKYWDRIIKAVNNSNFDNFKPSIFGPRYKMIMPEPLIYSLDIEYKNNNKYIYLAFFENTFYGGNYRFYDITDKTKELLNIFEEIIKDS